MYNTGILDHRLPRTRMSAPTAEWKFGSRDRINSTSVRLQRTTRFGSIPPPEDHAGKDRIWESRIMQYGSQKTVNNMGESKRDSMADTTASKNGMTAQKVNSTLEYLWLTYYNDTLYEKGLITEAERNRMRILIKNRSSLAR